MEDPFYRDNEDRALALMEHDYTFTRTFAHTLTTHKVLLCCEGLDTLATITLNGATVASTQNMHRRYEFDVTDLLKDGENTISIRFASPTKYAKKMHAEDPVPGAVSFPYQGFYHLRKAHSMFGWDWGPRLPDAGIWRDIYLLIQDMMWACCTPPDNELMRREMAAEVRDSLLRLRHHASLGVIAGNNEVEDQLAGSKEPPVGRFPAIEEDEPPYRLLCNEYPAAK